MGIGFVLGVALAASAASEPSTPRRLAIGVHLGLNATVMADLSAGPYAYAGIAVQALAVAHLAAPTLGFPVACMGFGGVGFSLWASPAWRISLDVLAQTSLLLLNGGTLFSAGLLSGPRFLHRSGVTIALKLPVIGYAGSLSAPRSALVYYYIASLFSVPLVTVGYTF